MLTHRFSPQHWPRGLKIDDDALMLPVADVEAIEAQAAVLRSLDFLNVKSDQSLSKKLDADRTLHGIADIAGNDFVVEIKAVAEVTFEHVAQLLLYAVMKPARRAILWDVRHGRHYIYDLSESERDDIFKAAVACESI